ncbi:MAG TPA: hypothetical protein VMN03_13795 [Burkholderiales bacterium]|nr:hypothetical protein [Burkholderiales bacterium]
MAGAFRATGIDYFLGGSLASSFQGEPRATNDIDFVVDMTPAQAEELASSLGEDFLVDTGALADALAHGRAWNVMHLPTVTKIDLIPLGTSPFDKSEFSRRMRVEARPGETVFLKQPEDTVLRKLLWFRDGGGVSERQWRDVVGVLRHSRAQIDAGYMNQWAATLALGELLDAARREANPGLPGRD